MGESVPPLPGEDHHCVGCGLFYPEMPVEDAIELVRRVPGGVRAVASGHDALALRARPTERMWSAVEYACHLRDIYAIYTIRLHRTRVEMSPVLEPMLDDLRAARFRYNDRAIDCVLAELADNVDGFLEEAGMQDEVSWARLARRRPSEQRSARWLLRQAAHEGVHHIGDIAAVLDGTRSQGL